MKTKPRTIQTRKGLAAKWVFSLAVGTFVATASAQPTLPSITLTQLLAQGFTNRPGLLGYSLRVTGMQNVSSAVFDDIRQGAAHGGNIQFSWFNYAVSGASVGGGVLSFNGSVSLPPPLNEYEATIADAHTLQVGASGAINLGPLGGTFTIPHTFQFGALTIDEVMVTILPADRTFGGGAKFGIGQGSSYCPGPHAGPKLIGANFLIVDGKLDQLGLSGSQLQRPLGTTGALLDGLGGTVGNLAANHGRNWFVQATANVKGGCPVGGIYPLSLDAQATLDSSGYVEVNGDGTVFNIPAGHVFFRYNPPYTVAAGANVTFASAFFADCAFQVTSGPQFSGSASGRLEIPRYVPVAGGYTVARADASFDNSGFSGSVAVNVTPEIPSYVITPRTCPPDLCIKYWCPTWSRPGKTCRKCLSFPCIPEIRSPRVPAFSPRIGFRFQSGQFTFGPPPEADPMVEPWEKSFQETIVDPDTGDRLSFMGNWARVDKCSTGACGRPIARAAGFAAAAPPPPIHFTVPSGEESVMFRLTWENTNNTLAFMSVGFSDYPPLSVSSDEVFPGAHFLRPLDNGTSLANGAYLILDGSRREAIIGLLHPPAGDYSVQIDHTEGLGNYAVELLRQNVPPVVTVNSVTQTESPTEYAINYTSTYRFGSPPLNSFTRIFLAQTAFVPGTTRPIKAGGIYLVATLPSVHGPKTHYLHTDSLEVPDGDYHVIVNIDDANSLEVEAFSTQRITVHNATAPAPVPSFATRANPRGFTISWQPSPSSNIFSYIVAYTKSAMGNEFEFHQSVDADARTATVTNLSNGQPYLVTVFAMGTNGLQSCPPEKQRVIPTEGYGLNPPMIVSAPRVGATVGLPYVYFPEVFDADAVLRPSPPIPEGEEPPLSNEPQDGQGRQWTLVNPPAGMTIDPSGVIMWTPVEGQVGNHTVTICVTDVTSLPPLQEETNSLVSPRSGKQTYTLTVVGANNPPAFERNHYRFLTTPLLTAYAGEVYRYAPEMLFPTNKFTLTVEDGPPGLTVVQEGTTNVVVWPVTTNSRGHRVVLRAVPDLGPETTANDIILQEYFLDVSAPCKRLPQPTVITRALTTPEGFGLSWVGSAAAYQVQRTTNLIESTNTVWQSITALRPGEAVNFHVDTNSVPPHAIYRIFNIP